MPREKKEQRPPSTLTVLYLAVYNFASCLGWAYLLFLTAQNYLQGKSPDSLFDTVDLPLKIIQTSAVLEIIHCALGLVNSAVMITAMQVFSRLFIVWMIVHLEPLQRLDSTKSIALTTLLVAWSVTEIIRYSMYGLKLFGISPYFLTYLRYTLFIVLYPLGVGSEITLTLLKLGYIQENRPYSFYMPNKYNFSFDSYYFVLLVLIGYLPGFPQLYGYMLGQRKKILGGGSSKTKDQ